MRPADPYKRRNGRKRVSRQSHEEAASKGRAPQETAAQMPVQAKGRMPDGFRGEASHPPCRQVWREASMLDFKQQVIRVMRNLRRSTTLPQLTPWHLTLRQESGVAFAQNPPFSFLTSWLTSPFPASAPNCWTDDLASDWMCFSLAATLRRQAPNLRCSSRPAVRKRRKSRSARAMRSWRSRTLPRPEGSIHRLYLRL